MSREGVVLQGHVGFKNKTEARDSEVLMERTKVLLSARGDLIGRESVKSLQNYLLYEYFCRKAYNFDLNL